MKFLTAIVPISLIFFTATARSCSPPENWRPPTSESAFRDATVVVHAKVVSQTELRNKFEGQVLVMKMLKGEFSGDKVVTASYAACGIGRFKVGQEYVFFFPSAGQWFVSQLVQPSNLSARQILSAIKALPN